MADITMCAGDGCPKKGLCYRYLAVPDEHWQSFFTEVPTYTKDGCEYFIPIGRRKKNKNVSLENLLNDTQHK
jgi:hypothetical protein